MRTSSPKETSSRRRYGASFAGPSAIEVRPDALDDGGQLRLGHPREHREGQALARQRLRDREVALPVAKVRVRLREVHWVGVVAAGADTPLPQEECEG